MNFRTKTFVLAVLAAMSFTAAASDEAKSGGYSGRDIVFSVQYQPAGETYKAGYGGNLFSFRREGGWAPYIGFVSSKRDHEPMYEDLALNAFGDPVEDRFRYVEIYNVGVNHHIAGGIAGYVGIGWAHEDGYARKHDPDGILSSNNTYYVRDAERDTNGFNANAGLLWVGELWTVEVGYNTYGKTGYVGIGFRYPVPEGGG